jgi:hypothetical protein
MLAERRRTHVALEVLTRGLVVESDRYEPGDRRERRPFGFGLTAPGGCLDIARRPHTDAAIRGIGTSNECREQRHKTNSFAMCVFHTSSSAMVRLVKRAPYPASRKQA